MSQIYIKEPPTNGKVLLKTTLGDIDIELWSKEAPLACRNFVQLSLEGYYNGTMFHRVVQDFIAQGGDPTGTGEGGESIYGATFKDEFHSRLKFNRRGLVGMANGGRDDNSSQFFLTLNRTDDLTNKHTLFGKVTGDTLYNMIRLNEIHADKEGRPFDPVPKILKTKVLLNPFDDLVPRIDPRKLEKRVEKPKSRSRATKNFDLLSFGEEAEDDEGQVTIASKDLKIKSSHDVLTDDPKLSSELAVDTIITTNEEGRREKRKRKRMEDDQRKSSPTSADVSNEEEGEEEEEESNDHYDRRMKEQVKKELGHVEENWEDMLMEDKTAIRTAQLRQESKQLRLEMKQDQRRREEEAKQRQREALERENVPDVIKDLRREKMEYKRKKKTLKGGDREQQTLNLLEKFKARMGTARSKVPLPPSKGDVPLPPPSEMENPGLKLWMGHQITFEDSEDRVVLAKDANVQNEDTYDISDPRHPLNKRRRAEAGGEQVPRRTKDRNRK